MRVSSKKLVRTYICFSTSKFASNRRSFPTPTLSSQPEVTERILIHIKVKDVGGQTIVGKFRGRLTYDKTFSFRRTEGDF